MPPETIDGKLWLDSGKAPRPVWRKSYGPQDTEAAEGSIIMSQANYMGQGSQYEQVDIRYTRRTYEQVPPAGLQPPVPGFQQPFPPSQIPEQGFQQPMPIAQPPVVVQPYGVDPAVAIQMQATIDEYRQRLREVEKRSTLKEEALKMLYSPDKKGYLVMLPSGKPQRITDFVFLGARLLHFAEPYQVTPHIELTFGCVAEPLLISEDVYFNDKRLIHSLQQHTNSKILLYSSLRHTMALIRSEVDSTLMPLYIPFLAGWGKLEDQWKFRIFPGFRTGGSRSAQIQEPEQPKTPPFTAAHTAAEEQMKAFSAIVNPALRSLLFLWFHSSFFATLLNEWQYHIPKALYLSIPGGTAECYLTELLSFNNEAIVPLSADPAEFCRHLAGCKDHLLLVRETDVGKSCLKNLEQLSAAQNTGCVHLPGDNTVPFHALSVVLGREDSPLGEWTEMVLIYMEKGDFDLTLCEQLCSDGFKAEYWSALAAYTEQHISDLQRCLQQGGISARRVADDLELSTDCGSVLGVLRGVASFLTEFYTSVSLSLGEVIGDTWEDELIQALVTSSCRPELTDGLAELFAKAARKLIREKKLALYQWGQSWTQQPPYGAVYRSTEAYAFDRAAFQAICLETDCDPAAVKRELARRGLLKGKRTNAASYTTRLSARNAYGQRRYLQVYSVDRQLIDVPGEPSPELS